jgi:hypothetical protein
MIFNDEMRTVIIIAKRMKTGKTCQSLQDLTAFEGRKKSKSVMKSGVILIQAVSWQSWRAATQNPVEALRYE